MALSKYSLGIERGKPVYRADQHLPEVLNYVRNFDKSGRKRDRHGLDAFGGDILSDLLVPMS